jgi:hypothetical protein
MAVCPYEIHHVCLPLFFEAPEYLHPTDEMGGSPLISVATTVLLFLAMKEARSPMAYSQSYLQYSTVAGFFLQDEPGTDPTTFDYVTFYSCIDRVGALLTVAGLY